MSDFETVWSDAKALVPLISTCESGAEDVLMIGSLQVIMAFNEFCP